MNHWTELSIKFANQRNYLDELFKIYPTNPDCMRNIDKNKWKFVEKSFNERDNVNLIQYLLSLDLFPIKELFCQGIFSRKFILDVNKL
ncbi:MAG: hypothetical protein LBP78_06495 [Acidaminococcales bacterium]|jgi:hypothetical protein|nr:hypothetical protein [Acidaminococcales bacterium]